MSLENAKRFIDALRNDQAQQKRLASAGEPAKVVGLAIQAGSERGLTFTAEELLQAVGPPPGDDGGALSDDQLGSVVGGFGITPSQIQVLIRSLDNTGPASREDVYNSLTPSQQKQPAP